MKLSMCGQQTLPLPPCSCLPYTPACQMRHVHCANGEGHFKLVFRFYFVPLCSCYIFALLVFRSPMLQFCSLVRELRQTECYECYDNYATHLRHVSEEREAYRRSAAQGISTHAALNGQRSEREQSTFRPECKLTRASIWPAPCGMTCQ